MHKQVVQIFAIPRSGIHMFTEWLIAGWGHGFYVQQYEFPLDADRAPAAENLVIVHEDPYARNNVTCIADLTCHESPYQSEMLSQIIWMRDLYNLAASKIKISTKRQSFRPWHWSDRTISDWLLLAKDASLYRISYNRFLLSEQYRRFLASEYRLWSYTNAEDHRKNHVAKHAGGSSFTGRSEKPDPLAVLFRWKEVVDHPEMQAVFENEEVADRSVAMFGWCVGKGGRLHGDPLSDLRRW